MGIRASFNQIQDLSEEARLVVVTKNRSAEEVLEVLEAGATIIGENRVQEARRKFAKLAKHSKWENIEKHLIGHLQTNKAKDAVALFDVIQSLDSLRLAEALNKAARDYGKVQRVLIQVNISEDKAKYGIPANELLQFYDDLKDFANLKVEGLMTIIKLYEDSALTRVDFAKMKLVFNEFVKYSMLEHPILSMGMSSDYKLALEYDSNMIRVGTAIFG